MAGQCQPRGRFGWRGGMLLVVLVAASCAFSLAGRGAQAAYACATDPALHCHGTVRWSPSPDNWGVDTATINVSCLRTPNGTGSDFITAEYWVGTNNDPNGQTWIEQGMAYGNPVGAQHYWYWADERPGHPYAEHDQLGLSANTNTDYQSSIHYIGNNQWNVLRGGNTEGMSVANPPNSNFLQAGVEMTNGNAFVDGIAKSLAYYKTDDTVHSGWNSGDHAVVYHDGNNNPVSVSWTTNYTAIAYSANAGGC
jgi:hypothetical protein